METPENEPQQFEKERIRLPDGRELIYYRFFDPKRQPTPGEAPERPNPKP